MIRTAKSMARIGAACAVLCAPPGLARAAEPEAPGSQPSTFSCEALQKQRTTVAPGRTLPDDLRRAEALAALGQSDLDKTTTEALAKAFASVPFERTVEEADAALINAA